MINLKPNKIKIRLTAQVIVFLYFAIIFSEFMIIRGNIQIEEQVIFTDEAISVTVDEFNNSMKQLQEEALLLSKDDKREIQNIKLLYASIKWFLLTLASYIAACLILKNYNND